MTENAVSRLNDFGQSPWLDFISRSLVRSGGLDELIERWGLGGVTSNPAIFEKAIAHSADYDEEIRAAAAAGASVKHTYERLVLDDVRRAADALGFVYEHSGKLNGYVSLEVSPHLADDTERTIAEAERLWATLDRPNVMIKVPGTEAGLGAVETLIGAGVNVNVTLLFSPQRYGRVADAFLAGLERAADAGRPLGSIASVASFFLSRIDTLVDARLERIAAAGSATAAAAHALRGEAAIACARSAYATYRALVASARCEALVRSGGRMQRLLWASTGTKNPAYDDLKYVEPLIGPDTVSTMPMDTLEAYERHGVPALRLGEDAPDGGSILRRLAEIGIDMDDVAAQLVADGIDKFFRPFDASHRAIVVKVRAAPARGRP
jgi:transaldolase